MFNEFIRHPIYMKYKLITGVIIFVIDLAILWYRRDILVELFQGTPANEVDISKLLLPIILLILSLFLIFTKKKDNETPKSKS